MKEETVSYTTKPGIVFLYFRIDDRNCITENWFRTDKTDSLELKKFKYLSKITITKLGDKYNRYKFMYPHNHDAEDFWNEEIAREKTYERKGGLIVYLGDKNEILTSKIVIKKDPPFIEDLQAEFQK